VRVRAPLALVVVASLAFALGGCAVRQLARTVGAGRTEFGVLVGGPLQSQLGFPAPLPEHRLHGRYGLTGDLDLSFGLPVAPLVSSILAFDLGFVAQIVRLPQFAFSTSVRLHSVYDLDDDFHGTYYPELALHLEQKIDRHFAFVFGTSALVQSSPPAERPDLFLAPYLGVEVTLGEHALSLAAAWIDPWLDSRSVVRWEPAGYGAIVVSFGWRIQVGGIR
jgi:hypothetical protein